MGVEKNGVFMSHRLLLLGCGNMGGAILARWIHAGLIGEKGGDVTICKPTPAGIPQGVRHVTDPADLAGECFDLLMVAVKPQMIDTALPPLLSAIGHVRILYSVAAGYSLSRLKDHSAAAHEAGGTAHPDAATVCVRAMPNLPSKIGQGLTAVYAPQTLSADDRAMVDTLIAATGTALWVDSEDRIDRATAAAGSGSGFVFQILESYLRAVEGLGFSPDEARTLVQATFAGGVALAGTADGAGGEGPVASPCDLPDYSDLRRSVTSKAGTTEAGLNQLNGDGALDRLFADTLDAAYQRAVALR